MKETAVSLSDTQLRANINEAMIYAPAKWSAYVLRIAQAYEAAYKCQTDVLEDIAAKKRIEAEFASALVSIVLPSFVGGFAGAIINGKGKQVLDTISDQASKFRWGVAIDTAKTVVTDLYKVDAKMAYESLYRSSGWKPASVSATAFLTSVQGAIAEYVTAAADAMNLAKLGRSKRQYRDVLIAIYYGPFIRQAPTEADLWTVSELTPVMEIFLWVQWANHRDTAYWLKRISEVTEAPAADFQGKTRDAVAGAELSALDSILERLDKCGVNRAYVTQGMTALDGRRFLNLLWVRRLGSKYQDTLLGELLARLADGSRIPVPIFRRPKTYALK